MAIWNNPTWNRARFLALALVLLAMGATLLALMVNPFEAALAYLGLLVVAIAIGLLTHMWGGLFASALIVFAIVWFNQYAGIYPRENQLLNIGTELAAFLLAGPLAGALGDALGRMRRETEHWLARAEDLSVHDETFGTLKPEWARVRLDEEALRAARFARPLAVVVLQLDPRPEHTHASRAERVAALSALIRAARAAAPPPAVVAHAGGNQVLVILPEHDPRATTQVVGTLQTQLVQTVYFPPALAPARGAATMAPGGIGRPLRAWGVWHIGQAGTSGAGNLGAGVAGAVLLAEAQASLAAVEPAPDLSAALPGAAELQPKPKAHLKENGKQPEQAPAGAALKEDARV